MYLMLGTLHFETLDVLSVDINQAATYAEHKVIKGKAKLQATGISLEEISLNIRLHHSLGKVESRYQALLKMKDSLTAQALVWGKDKFKGYFVIEQVTSKTVITDVQGDVLCRELSITLKESNEEPTPQKSPALALNVTLPITELPALEKITGNLSKEKESVKKGVEKLREVKQKADQARELFENVRSVAKSPLQLANVVGAIDNIEAVFGESDLLLGAKSIISDVAGTLEEAEVMKDQVMQMKQSLDEVKAIFSGEITEDNWFNRGSEILSHAQQHIDNLNTMAAGAIKNLALRRA